MSYKKLQEGHLAHLAAIIEERKPTFSQRNLERKNKQKIQWALANTVSVLSLGLDDGIDVVEIAKHLHQVHRNQESFTSMFLRLQGLTMSLFPGGGVNAVGAVNVWMIYDGILRLSRMWESFMKITSCELEIQNVVVTGFYETGLNTLKMKEDWKANPSSFDRFCHAPALFVNQVNESNTSSDKTTVVRLVSPMSSIADEKQISFRSVTVSVFRAGGFIIMGGENKDHVDMARPTLLLLFEHYRDESVSKRERTEHRRRIKDLEDTYVLCCKRSGKRMEVTPEACDDVQYESSLIRQVEFLKSIMFVCFTKWSLKKKMVSLEQHWERFFEELEKTLSKKLASPILGKWKFCGHALQVDFVKDFKYYFEMHHMHRCRNSVLSMKFPKKNSHPNTEQIFEDCLRVPLECALRFSRPLRNPKSKIPLQIKNAHRHALSSERYRTSPATFWGDCFLPNSGQFTHFEAEHYCHAIDTCYCNSVEQFYEYFVGCVLHHEHRNYITSQKLSPADMLKLSKKQHIDGWKSRFSISLPHHPNK